MNKVIKLYIQQWDKKTAPTENDEVSRTKSLFLLKDIWTFAYITCPEKDVRTNLFECIMFILWLPNLTIQAT